MGDMRITESNPLNVISSQIFFRISAFENAGSVRGGSSEKNFLGLYYAIQGEKTEIKPFMRAVLCLACIIVYQ